MLPEILIRAKLFQEAKFFIIIHISYLPEVNIQVKNSRGVLDRLVPRVRTWDYPYSMVILDKEGCNRRHGLSAANNLGTPEPKFLQSGCKLTADLQPVKLYLCLKPDQKMVRPKRLQIIKKSLAPYKNASLFFVEKWIIKNG